jgi:hypothetical protein
MIISHSSNFIFIKPEKVAGSSVECAILPHLLSTDVYISDSHMLPFQVIGNYRIDIFDYFKFSIVRNPYDKMVSHYYWQQSIENNRYSSFDSFVKEFHDHRTISNWKFYSINNEYIMDKVIKFENLQNDLKDLPININIDISNIFEKSHTRPANTAYQDLYSTTSREMVEEQCFNEIEMFDYKFEEE